MSEKEFDVEALDAFSAVCSGFEGRWQEGTHGVLQERNPALLDELTRLETVINSLIRLPVKPKILQKQFRDALDRYAVVSNDCISYASRHIKN